jgi:hypothetical protein
MKLPPNMVSRHAFMLSNLTLLFRALAFVLENHHSDYALALVLGGLA